MLWFKVLPLFVENFKFKNIHTISDFPVNQSELYCNTTIPDQKYKNRHFWTETSFFFSSLEMWWCHIKIQVHTSYTNPNFLFPVETEPDLKPIHYFIQIITKMTKHPLLHLWNRVTSSFEGKRLKSYQQPLQCEQKCFCFLKLAHGGFVKWSQSCSQHLTVRLPPQHVMCYTWTLMRELKWSSCPDHWPTKNS